MIKLNFVLILFLFASCSSYEKYRQVTEELEIPAKIYKADFNQTWQAVIQVMKRFDVAFQNQEAGKIKSRWMDNTLEVNFTPKRFLELRLDPMRLEKVYIGIVIDGHFLFQIRDHRGQILL